MGGACNGKGLYIFLQQRGKTYMINYNLIRLLLILSLFSVLTACTNFPITLSTSTKTLHTGLKELKVCDSTGVNSIILSFAQQAGIFEKYGLIVDMLPVSAGPEGIAALIADEVDLCHIGGGATVNAALAGEDFAIVAGIINKPFFALVARPEIGSVQDIKGKGVATGSAGSSSEIFLRTIVPLLNLRQQM
jgi:ABC-type nitrate/sulfonate/bicarbonate transport system substrate-binding protein